MQELPTTADVVVVGAGNAGLCAALASAEAGASVLVLEKASPPAAGGNSRFVRHYAFAYENGAEDLATLCPGVRDELAAGRISVGTHTCADIVDSAIAASGGRVDRRLMRVLADRSLDTMRWLRAQGMQWEINYPEARETGGRHEWPNPALVLRPRDGGRGVLRALHAGLAARSGQARVAYDSAVTDLRTTPDGAVSGVAVRTPAGVRSVHSERVILAGGGFEANPEMRARYLGPNADLMKVRGTRHNTGECLELALRKGAGATGQWSGAHATIIRSDADEYEIAGEAFPYAFPHSLLVDAEGRRFTDEGADVLHRTYGRLGGMVTALPGAIAFELFDARTRDLRRKITAPGPYDRPLARGSSVAEVAGRSAMVDPAGLRRTVEEFNRCVGDSVAYDPLRLDGRRTHGLTPAKSNWAQPLVEPPFELFAVAPAITFTYGGLASDTRGRVLDNTEAPIPGLYVAGEMAGTFYRDYPVGVALTKGAVFGRIAGTHAATAR